MISYNSYDIYKDKLVPVIASFDTSGNIAPLYIRVRGENYKILSYVRIEKVKISKPEFHCRIDDHGIIRFVKLIFFPDEHLWVMLPDT